MQDIEPYDNWQYLYASEADERSPFYGREYNAFEFSNTVYNYYIHPLWDEFGSRTLYLKVLMADYEEQYMIIELIDEFMYQGIRKFILITENVLNFHSSDDCYYEEWYEDVEEKNGWIVSLNMPSQTQYDFRKARLDHYVEMLSVPAWRTMKPDILYNQVDNLLLRRLSQ